MDRILLVANQTLGGDEVTTWLRERIAEDDCELHILVPSSVDPQSWVHDEDSDRELAEQRLDEALDRFGVLGIPVTGEVGDSSPVGAVLDVLRTREVDEIVVSTLPIGVSRWVRLDLVHRIDRAVDVPVTHLVAAKAPAAART
jgi:hypothetical protein